MKRETKRNAHRTTGTSVKRAETREKPNPLKQRFFKQKVNLPIKIMFPGKLKMLILQIL